MGLVTSVFLTCPPDNWQIWQAPCLAFPLDMEETHRSHPWSDPARKNTKLSCFLFFCLHPRKLTWNLKMKVWKMIFLFKQVIFRFHVNFQGCNVFFQVILVFSGIESHHAIHQYWEIWNIVCLLQPSQAILSEVSDMLIIWKIPGTSGHIHLVNLRSLLFNRVGLQTMSLKVVFLLDIICFGGFKWCLFFHCSCWCFKHLLVIDINICTYIYIYIFLDVS